MWWLGFVIAGILILAAICYALVVASKCSNEDDDYWMGY